MFNQKLSFHSVSTNTPGGSNGNNNINNNGPYTPLDGTSSSSSSSLLQEGTVVIRHCYDRHLRVAPKDLKRAVANGGIGRNARWHLEIHGDLVKFCNLRTSKYLRMTNGSVVNVGGSGGKFTLFKCLAMDGNNKYALESNEFPGRYLKVEKGDQLKMVHSSATITNEGIFEILPLTVAQEMKKSAKHQWNNDNNERNLVLEDNGIVVIQHAFNRHLRVVPKNESQTNASGGRGKFAQWVLEVHGNNFKFKSNKSGRYLRIIKNGSTVDADGGGGKFTLFHYMNGSSLESNEFPGTFLAVKASNLGTVFAVNPGVNNDSSCSSGDDEEYSMQFTVIPLPNARRHGFGGRSNSNGNRGRFPNPYTFQSNNNKVVVRHAHGKHFRVHPRQQTEADAKGGQGKYAQWTVELFNNNRQLKLLNNFSGKYLRIRGENDLNVNGNGGRFTLFNIHFLEEENAVKLESDAFPGRYIACRPNMEVKVGGGGRHCLLTFLVQGGHNNNSGSGSGGRSSSMNENVLNEQQRVIESQRALICQQQRFIEQLIQPQPGSAGGNGNGGGYEREESQPGSEDFNNNNGNGNGSGSDFECVAFPNKM